MKRYFRLLCTALLLGGAVCLSSNLWLGDVNDAATARSDEPLVDSEVDASAEDYGTPKFKLINLPPKEQPPRPSQIDVKVWFELSDGTFVNPFKKVWEPNERFRIRVAATKPIFVVLFQIGADGESKIVYPSESVRSSKEVLQPKEEKLLPSSGTFAFDDDEKDEIMSLVVVSADWVGIKDELFVDDQEKPQLTEIAENTIKALCDGFVSNKIATCEDFPKLSPTRAGEVVDVLTRIAPLVKFQEVAPLMEASEKSEKSDDVCVYLFTTEQVGLWTLTMKKQ